MTARRVTIALLLILVAALAAHLLPSCSPTLQTRAETSKYEETSTYADVERITRGLATSPLVHAESFGKTEEGRDLPLLVIADPKVSSPQAARELGRPLVLVQANIHAGEV